MKRPVRLTTEALPEVGQKAFTTPTEQASLLAESKAYTDSIAAGKQDPLVSGTNIRTVNGNSLLGGGDLTIISSYHSVTTLANNQATAANTTPVILTGMSFSYAINSIYIIRVLGSISSAAATTGAGFQLDVSSAVTQIAMNFFHQLANTGTITGGSSIADNASAGVSSGLPVLNTAVPVSVQGILRTGANTGTAQLMYRSETTAVTTALAGLTMIVEKVA